MKYFNRVFIRGDTHGDFTFLPKFCAENETTTSDLLIILGDSGINYYKVDSNYYKQIAELIADMPITLFCVRGNHEDRPGDRPECSLHDADIGEKVYISSFIPNCYFAIDGGIYYFNDMSFLTIGGAFSVDKEFRLINHYKWVENEELSDTEKENIFNKVKGKYFDVILSHTCPDSIIPKEFFLPFLKPKEQSNRMELFLEKIKQSCVVKKWYFGHFHGEKTIKQDLTTFYLLFQNIKKIKIKKEEEKE